MKAKAGLFSLLIGMISLVGFGATTADPVQNSITDSNFCFEAELVLVSVDVMPEIMFEINDQLNLNYVSIFLYSFEISYLEKTIDVDFMFYSYRKLEDPGLINLSNYETLKTTTKISKINHIENQVDALNSKFLLPDIS